MHEFAIPALWNDRFGFRNRIGFAPSFGIIGHAGLIVHFRRDLLNVRIRENLFVGEIPIPQQPVAN